MTIVDAFGERKAQEVMRDTWGHLAPKNNTPYYGTVLFACSAYGGTTAFLEIDFKTRNREPLEDNPWSHEHITDHIIRWICDQANHNGIQTDGKVWRFSGTYITYKSGKYRMEGKFHEMNIVNMH